MEHLTKQQIILVALLVSFMTSIATGIVTVSLMEEAPPAVTQTINRVVEKTVEKIIPIPNSPTVVTKETVIVKADDMVIAAVDKNIPSIIRVKEIKLANEGQKEEFGAIGVMVSKDGLIATEGSLLVTEEDGEGNTIPESYTGTLFDNKSAPLSLVYYDRDTKLAFFEIKADDEKEKKVPPAVVLGNSDNIKLGQTIISVGGSENNTISTGIVSSLLTKKADLAPAGTATSTEANDSNLKPDVYSIKTDDQPTDTVLGAILLNLHGEVIGINAGSAAFSKNAFLPSNLIKSGLEKAKATKEKERGKEKEKKTDTSQTP